jgi:hypothetical protein
LIVECPERAVRAEAAFVRADLIPGAVARETNAGHMVTGDDNDLFGRHVLDLLGIWLTCHVP